MCFRNLGVCVVGERGIQGDQTGKRIVSTVLEVRLWYVEEMHVKHPFSIKTL
jgi:hypothetical protein